MLTIVDDCSTFAFVCLYPRSGSQPVADGASQVDAKTE
jgi:hypothetical protein